jgi:N-acetylmuramoyl-L-alanine amidase
LEGEMKKELIGVVGTWLLLTLIYIVFSRVPPVEGSAPIPEPKTIPIKTQRVEAKEQPVIDLPPVKVNEFSYEDAQLLMKVAEAEAGNQGTDGMWLIMSVIINRVNSEDFPNTIHSVIYQEGQYSTVPLIGSTEPSTECHEALARIEMGNVQPEIVAFENGDSLDRYFSWAFKLGDHNFYTMQH